MNLKRFCSFVLCICYLSLSVASLTWADTASSSNATRSNTIMPMSLAATDYTVSQFAYYTLNGNNVYMGTSPTVPANASRFYRNYTFSGSNYASLLLEISGCNINNIESVQIEYSTSSGWVGNRTITDFRDYWVKLPNNANYAFEIPIGARSGYTVTLIFNLKANSPSFNLITYIYDNAVYQTLDGLYVGDTANKAKLYDIQLSSAQTPNSGFAILDNTNKTLGLRMLLENDVWFYKGFEYSLVFNSYIPIVGIEFISSNQWLGSVANGYWGAKMEKSGNRYILTFTPTYNVLANSITFSMVHSYSNPVRWFIPNVYVESISSTYIPKSDSGSQGQVTAANTTIIKNVVQNISNTVSNISNQITNTTTTITNTITNTANQIKDSVNQSAEKISQTVTNKVNEVNNTINSVGQKTQEKIEDTKKAVVDKLEDTKTGIITGIIDGLKSLFIPSDDFFKTWFDDMYSFFDERLGFLMLPVDLLVNLIDMIVSADSSNAGIPFPEIKWEDTVLIPAQTVRIEILDTDFGKELQDKLYFVGNVIMIGALLSLMHRKIEEVLRS